jgi:hypothetical protein
MSDLYAQLEDLEGMVDSHAAREHVRKTIRMTVDVGSTGVFGPVIRGYDRADIAESVGWQSVPQRRVRANGNRRGTR